MKCHSLKGVVPYEGKAKKKKYTEGGLIHE